MQKEKKIPQQPFKLKAAKCIKQVHWDGKKPRFKYKISYMYQPMIYVIAIGNILHIISNIVTLIIP